MIYKSWQPSLYRQIHRLTIAPGIAYFAHANGHNLPVRVRVENSLIFSIHFPLRLI